MSHRAIDVVIPVYNAAADLRRCVTSVLAHTSRPHRLVLIDDASPDPAIAACFDDLAQRALAHVVLLRNDGNLGFTGTANRAFALSDADVVLLNSDTVVTSGWLDALARCAASDPAIGTVTPFSNNAEICSHPLFCRDNPWPEGADPEPVRASLAQAAVPTYPDLPTGVGFCFYVRRALLDAVGGFDPVFGLGYGEENDLCMRAAAAGFRNVLCDDAFVLHLGGRSFEGRKATLGQRNLELLAARHPRYFELIRDYIARDPLRAIRDAALSRQRVVAQPEGGVLHVIGGVDEPGDACARGIVERAAGPRRHYLAYPDGDAFRLEEPLPDGGSRSFDFRREDGESWAGFLGGLCGAFGVEHVQVHGAPDGNDGIAAAIVALGRRAARVDGIGCTCVGESVGAFDVAREAFTAFAPIRIRDALGYVAWRPPISGEGERVAPLASPEPSPASPDRSQASPDRSQASPDRSQASPEPSPASPEPLPASLPSSPAPTPAAIDGVLDTLTGGSGPGVLLRTAFRFGETRLGRGLRRMTPLRVRAALKERLR